MSSFVVTGGTGVVGRAVVERLLAAGHAVRVTSRRPEPDGGTRPYAWSTVDYRTGEGLEDALRDAAAVVHCAGGSPAAHRRLVEVARRVGVGHLVYISIVGVDRVPLGFYRGRLAIEHMIEASGVPHTIQRTTQFHDLIRTVLAVLARPPVMLVPDLPFQPVDVREVADRLVELAFGEPLGRAEDLGGPEVHRLPDLARMYLDVIGRRRRVVPFRLPGKIFRGYRAGRHLTSLDRGVGTVAFADYLAAHPDPSGLSYRGRRR